MDVRLPRLGEGADSGTVSTIFVKEGDTVRKDQSILELESEKAVASIPTPVDGTISKIHIKEGDEIKVGTLIFSVAEDGSTKSTSPAPPANTPEPTTTGEESAPKEEPGATPAEQPTPEPPTVKQAGGAPPAASPSLRRLAREIGLDLSKIRGTGNGGRLLNADVRSYIQRLQTQGASPKPSAAQASAPATKAPPASIDFSKWGKVEKKKMTSLPQR